MGKALADREHDIERWEIDLAAVAADRAAGLVVSQLRRQIAEAKQIIADSGY